MDLKVVAGVKCERRMGRKTEPSVAPTLPVQDKRWQQH